MATEQDATVITFPARPAPAAGADIGGGLVELETDLRTAVERLRALSIELDRRLQFGGLENVGDPIAFTVDMGNLIDRAARSVAEAATHIHVATDTWNTENKQQ